MDNAVLTVTHNCLELTKKCIESIRGQDAPTAIYVFDNCSTDGTREWLDTQLGDGFGWNGFPDRNRGVSKAWNIGLDYLFHHMNYPCALVVGNDTILPPWFYRELAASAFLYDRAEFVTGVGVDNLDAIKEPAEFQPRSPHPDFSAFLIGRSVWDKLGPFDERFVNYAGDCDFHLRGHRMGVPMWKANVPYFHLGSATTRTADFFEQRELAEQAEKDREEFCKKWGCMPGTEEYNKLFE
jgi:GT2 family glycosyltransferase